MQPETYALFLSELEEALAKEHLRLSDDARAYLAGLLAGISWKEIHSRVGSSRTLAEALNEALLYQPEGEMKELLLRRVGNSALLLCGLWWRSVASRAAWGHGADQEYHERIGQHAYYRIDHELFQELADKFIGVVDVFARIGDKIIEQSPVQSIHAYALLLKTNNRLVEKVLKEQGLLVGIDLDKTH